MGWAHVLWFKFLPFYLASVTSQLQFASLFGHQVIFFYVSFKNSLERICNIWKCGCVSTTIDWKVTTIVEWSPNIWFIFKGKLQLTSNMHLECAWFSNVRIVYSCLHVMCPPCGLATYSHSSKKLKKMIFCGSHHYLPRSHSYERNKNSFNGETEMKGPPTRVSTSNIVKWAK
jgi:hypothetical protein